MLRPARRSEPASDQPTRSFILPPELQGWTPEEPLSEIKTTDGTVLRVLDRQGICGVYKRYAIGSLTSGESYDCLRQSQAPSLARLVAHGQFHGTDFELFACDTNAVPFNEWIQRNVNESAAVWFIRQCVDILGPLARDRIAPLWLEPTSFVLSRDALILVDYGKLMQVRSTGSGFLATLPASRTEYAAAEIFKTKVWYANSPLYSVGAIAMQIVSGHAPTHQATESGDLDFLVIQDDALRYAIQGLLYPDPARRWQLTDLVKWTEGVPVDLPDWSRLRPGAARSAFVLHGRNFYLPSDLAEPLLQNLDLSAERLDEVLDWLNDNPAMREVSNEIVIHRRQGRSSDWLLLRLAHRLNPACPRIWRGISLDDAVVERNLFELGRRAMNGDPDARALIDHLQKAELRGVYVPTTEARS